MRYRNIKWDSRRMPQMWGAFGSIALKSGVIPNGIELQAAGAIASLKLWNTGTVHQGSVETAPFYRGEFSYISTFETLEHVLDPISILKQLNSFLGENGIIVISVPSSDYFRLKYWIYKGHPLSALLRSKFSIGMRGENALIHNHINTFSPKAAILMMKKAGFEIIEVSGIGSEQKQGFIGRLFHLVAKLTWYLSLKKIIFSPSIFIIAKHSN